MGCGLAVLKPIPSLTCPFRRGECGNCCIGRGVKSAVRKHLPLLKSPGKMPHELFEMPKPVLVRVDIEIGLKSFQEDALTVLDKVEIILIEVLKIEGVVLAAVRQGLVMY